MSLASYVSGACAGPAVDEITDRSVPAAAAGGADGFAELAAEAKRAGLALLVDCDHRVSASSHARRYTPLLAYCMDGARKFAVPMIGALRFFVCFAAVFLSKCVLFPRGQATTG